MRSSALAFHSFIGHGNVLSKRDSDSYSFIFRTDHSLQTETNKVLPILFKYH